MVERLKEAEIGQALESMEGWQREEDKWIVKKYRFPTFVAGIAFVNEVAAISEKLKHHPMIAVDYRVVTLRMTTWSAGGLTKLDVQAAQSFDAAYEALLAKDE